ncbi:hypothetical protein [Acrocarpospora sp. B8E8]|uniref:hypothetical protein n=1 Tax=Acrocarpospora sp. B8E8 TaxID=3153572 RepID=UPI00325C7599
MLRFDLGVFADAHHLLAVDPRGRDVRGLLGRIQVAAERLCMAGGMSHRVVVADCADSGARAIAEAFAADAAFRIRHVPFIGGIERAQVLAAEVFEAVAVRPDLRAVVVIGDEEVYQPLVDQLHRGGRALIACTARPPRSGAADGVIILPLGIAETPPPMQEINESLRRACQSLTPSTATDEESLVTAARAMLEALAGEASLSRLANTSGLTIHQVRAGLTMVAPAYTKEQLKLLDLFRRAVAGTSWSVARHGAKREDIRLMLNGRLPPGFVTLPALPEGIPGPFPDPTPKPA